MTAHKHAAMIKAKADKMELIVFFRSACGGEWHQFTGSFPDWRPSFGYFLCLPQHAKECLHWLNGGEVQQKVTACGIWSPGCIESYLDDPVWNAESDFMDEHCQFRIKPKKEKCLIVYRGGNVYGPYESESELTAAQRAHGQIIEIEIEV